MPLVSAGGGPGRNCEGLDSIQGLRCGHCRMSGIVVGTYTPGKADGLYGTTRASWSSARLAMTAAAARSPSATPAARASPSGMAASAAAQALSIAAACDGIICRNTAQFAPAIAASTDAPGAGATARALAG